MQLNLPHLVESLSLVHNTGNELNFCVHDCYGSGRRRDTLCTSGFMADVIFAHK